MFQQQVHVINMALMVLDSLCIVAAGHLAHYILSYRSFWLWSMEDYTFSLSILFIMFANNLIMAKVGLYSDRRTKSYLKLVVSVFNAVAVNFGGLAAVIFLMQEHDYSRAFLACFAILAFGLLLVARSAVNIYMNNFAGSNFNTRRLLLAGDSERGRLVLDALKQQMSLGHQIVEHLPVTAGADGTGRTLADLPRVLLEKEIDEVVFAVPKDRSINLQAHIDLCARMGIPARILPALWTPGKTSIRVEECQGVPFLRMNFNNFNTAGLLYKRILDIAGSAVGMIILGLAYPVIALAIKMDSPGPVFFKQERVGKNGRLFKLYKFRSMYLDAEKRKKELMAENQMEGPLFKMKDDPRITKVGKFLRKTSLDELPQFINVFKGEMSLVGTRPPTPDEVKEYDLPHHKRISGKPGITGLWQVSGRNRITDFNEVVRLDCQYLETWKFRTDLKILFRTVWVVLAREGAC